MTSTVSAAQAAPSVTPERLMQMAWSYAPPLIIEAAVRNGFFDALATKPMNASELAQATGSSERGVTAVMDALVGLALAARDRNGRYVLTAESDTFLVSARPGSLGGFFRHISDLIPAWLPLRDIVRTGEPARKVDSQETGAAFFSNFVESLFPLGYPAALGVAKSLGAPLDAPLQVLDLAAGSGVWSVAIAHTYPQARVTAVDWEGVLPVTKKVTARERVADRYEYIAGDILETDFGGGYDVATLGHILHSEGDARGQELLRKVGRSLKPGGAIVIAEFLANEERSGPPQALIFSVNMLVNTSAGRAFTFGEIRAWLEEAGFIDARTLEIPAPSLIVARKAS